MLNKCYIGDCREGLRAFVAAGLKAQVCVTSPPYWGLRDYGIKPSVWGGLPNCAHEWGDKISIQKGGPTGNTSGLTNRGANQARTAVKVIQAGQFCRCGAWLGTLGLEPDYRMYIDHMVEVMDLVREVLADDGTLWLNLGDSYAAGGNGWHQERRHAFHGHKPRHGADRVGIRKKPPPGLKPKDLCMMPARVALAMQEAGWWVRQDIIWHKPNPMPESVTDRCTKAHEYIFLLSKSARYYYDAEAIKEASTSGRDDMREKGVITGLGYLQQDAVASNSVKRKPVAGWDTGDGNHATVDHARTKKDQGRNDQGLADSTKFGRGAGWRDILGTAPTMRNKRSVWTVVTEPYPDAHFATFPRKLIEPCVLAGSRPGDVVLDPFMGSGTTAQVAEHLGRKWLGCEINPDYVDLQANRLRQQTLELGSQPTGEKEALKDEH